jgi:hypothetical protein
MIPFPLVNGHRHDFASIDLVANGRRFQAVRSCNYKDQLTPGVMRGTGSRKAGRTKGTHDATAQVEVYKGFAEDFLLYLTGADPTVGYGEVEFTVVVSYSSRGMPLTVDTLEGCRIVASEDSHSEGEEPLAVRFDLDLTDLKRNGKSIVSKPLL